MNNRSIYTILLFTAIFIGINQWRLDAQYKTQPTFATKINDLSVNQLKALALLLAKQAYLLALTRADSLMENVGKQKLEQTANILDDATKPYLDPKLEKLLIKSIQPMFDAANNSTRYITQLKREQPSITQKEIVIKTYEYAIDKLNEPYQTILQTIEKKQLSKARRFNSKNIAPVWPSEINVLNFTTVIGHWSSFVEQARQLKSAQ